jgi:predicted Rossmann fold flavoprotein
MKNFTDQRYHVAIIGGGASGLTSAVVLAKRGFRVIIFERLEKIGKKILASGNGKCNLMGIGDLKEKYNTPDVLKVLEDGIQKKIEIFFNKLGVYLKLDNYRYYPFSEESSTIVNAFLKAINELNITIKTMSEVVEVSGNGPFIIKTNENNIYTTEAVVLSSGSNALNGKDSTKLLQPYGHTINSFYPSLVPLACEKQHIRGLKGVRLNTIAGLYIDNKLIKKSRGDILFKDNGLSGSLIFELSTELARSPKKQNALIEIDLMNGIEGCELDRALGIGLDGLFHKEIVNNIRRRMKSNSDVRQLVKSYTIKITGAQSAQLAQVMNGGLVLSKFNIQTLESNKQHGIYATGEVLDVDGNCGGFNLMWAWGSGLLVGEKLQLIGGFKRND